MRLAPSDVPNGLVSFGAGLTAVPRELTVDEVHSVAVSDASGRAVLLAAAVLIVLGLAGCTGERTDQDAERSVKEDAEMLADVLQPLCERKSTCPQHLPLALMRSLAERNEVVFYKGRHFQVFLCVANKEHGVWAWSAPEYEAETHRGGEPCKLD